MLPALSRMGSSSSPATTSGKHDHDNDEALAPLMSDEDTNQEERRRVTPLPAKQLFVLCCMRLTEPVCFGLIFPFVNEMIEAVGITGGDTTTVGYYSGIVEGTFSMAQFFTVLTWGRLSDRIGRRPVLLIGMGCLSISTVLFGFSRSFLAMICARALSGALNGNVAVLKSVLGEVTDRTNRAQAFALLPLTWAIGSTLAPMIGGFLARPAERFPSIFGDWELFIDFPYLLPCMAGSLVGVIGVAFGYFFLEETLESKRKTHFSDKDVELQSPLTPLTPFTPYSPATPPALPMSLRAIVALARVKCILMNLIFIHWTSVSIEAVYVLFLYTPVAGGGVGFNGAQIGMTLSSGAVLSIIVNVFLFPMAARRLGTVNIYTCTTFLHLPLIALFPIVHYCAVRENHALKMIGIVAMVVLRCFGGLVFPCVAILVNLSSPNSANLGLVNGLAQTTTSAFRAIGPAVATTLFAMTMSHNLLGGNLVWAFQLSLNVCWIFVGRSIRHQKFNDDED